MGSPILWGPNNTAGNLQSQILQSNGSLLAYNGSKNYISYGNFENNSTTGWSLGNVSLTSGLPTGVPTFGSGASGNLSLAIVSSGQLAGNYSLSYASSTATTAGDFVASQAYTIDIEDQAKILAFRFAYKAAVNPSNGNFSGTSSNSFGVAIYDVTNSAWIIPAGVFNLVQNSGVGIATGTFQTPSNMTQFRIVVYNVTASAGAITMYLDDISTGPQVSPNAPSMSDMTAYTPTYVGLGTVTGSSMSWGRRGDKLIVSGSFTTGTLTGVVAKISLPSGLVVDTTKLSGASNQQQVGIGAQATTSAGASLSVIVQPSTSTTDLCLSTLAFTGVNPLSAENGTAFQSSTYTTIYAEVPIAGWSSNTVSSADTDTRVISATMSLLSNQSVGTSSDTKIGYDTVLVDTSGSISSSKFTVPVAGQYTITMVTTVTNVASTSKWYNIIYKNGARLVLNGQTSDDSTGDLSNTTSITVTLKPNDFIEGYVSSADASYIVEGSATFLTWLSINRISGPAVVQATESVNAFYYASANVTTGSNSTPINFDTKVYDSHNAATTGAGTWKYTVPVTGKYTMRVIFSSSGTSPDSILALKNGSIYLGVGFSSSSNPSSISGTGSVDIPCVAGDTIAVGHTQTGQVIAGAGTLTSGPSIIQIERIGN